MPEKVALLTGTSNGFGLLTSVELAKAGFHVGATMRDLGRREKLDQAAAAAGVAQKIDVRALDRRNGLNTSFDRPSNKHPPLGCPQLSHDLSTLRRSIRNRCALDISVNSPHREIS